MLAACPACNTSLSGDGFLRLALRSRAGEALATDPRGFRPLLRGKVGAERRQVPKRPSQDPTAFDLTVGERVLLFCVASGTDWQRAGVPGETVIDMIARRRAVRRNSRWPQRGRGCVGVRRGQRRTDRFPRISVSRGLTKRPRGTVVGRLPDDSTRKSAMPDFVDMTGQCWLRDSRSRAIKICSGRPNSRRAASIKPT